ncbi:MAG: CHC2 zinc finger domain-containing protein [Syntrophales bacterium]
MKAEGFDFYSELKRKNDIISIARILGYNGKGSKRYYQGDCPKHGSVGGTCLTIYSNTKSFICFHCGKGGDVINLVMMFKNCDHKTAVKYLAEKAGIPYWGGKELSLEEIKQREMDVEEKILVEEMLTEAARWYHNQLQYYPDIMEHLQDKNYGFSEDIIKELLLGFSPLSKKHDGTSLLADHLNSIPEFKGKIHLTGLFSFKSPSGPYWDYFKGRIVFPYWRGGKIVYMIARATTHTLQDEYEGRTDKNGNYEYIKYKKLRVYDPDDEKRKHFSKFIQNDVFMGEDFVQGADEIIITEGAPDWVSAVDHGLDAISPVTVSFREKDFEKLEILTSDAKSIFIINDNEVNQAGYNGAIKTGKYLTEKGRNVFLVVLPRPQGKDKIDLNEFLRDDTADDLRKLMSVAKSIPEVLIDTLPDDFIKAQPYIKEDIAPLLVGMEEGRLQHYIKLLVKQTKTNTKAIAAEIEAVKELKKQTEAREKEVKVDPEVEKAAEGIANDPLLFKKRLDVINQAGVVGERQTVAMYFCAMDSRLLPDNFTNPNTLSLKNSGHFGAGKSFTLTICTQIYPEECYFMITNGSAKSLYFLKGGLKHKVLIVTEGFQFETNHATDSELVYSIRSLISEGRVSYCVVEKGEDGNLVTIEKKIEGPTSFITTTTLETLEGQLEDRLFTIHPDEGIQQTKDILTMLAAQKDGSFVGLNKKTIDSWKEFHRSLKPVEIVIPFASKIATFININSIVPISTRRAFKRVMTVIQSVTCSYQHQRKKDDKGRLLAEISDYWMALQIVSEAFRENMGSQDKKTEERFSFIEEKEKVTSRELAEKFGVSATAISQWTSKRVKDGIISWCDENGYPFIDDKDLKKAKHSGKAYLKIADNYDPSKVTGLPSPSDLASDPDWDKDGKLLRMYDLELYRRSNTDEVFSGVKGVFNTPLNTSGGDEIVNPIPKSDDEDTGVKVFIQNQGNEKKNDNGNGQDHIETNNIEELEEEFSEIMFGDLQHESRMTPNICREGCIFYDGINDARDDVFKEFCWYKSTGKPIQSNRYCNSYERKDEIKIEGVLQI